MRYVSVLWGNGNWGGIMKAILSALSVGLALMVMGTSASAVPFSYRFESTVADSTFGLPASPGAPASITVTLDNGGTSDRSQVWTAADLELVIFNINNGVARALFFRPFFGGLTTSGGSFATDAAGNLISAPLDWSDTDVRRDFFTSFPIAVDMNWFIKGSNFLLFDDENFGPTVALALADVEGITDPASWSRVAVLPLPPTLLLLLAGLGGVALMRRGSPATTGAFAEARGA